MTYIRMPPPPNDNDGFWWLSTTFATFGVTVKDGRVTREKSAPISTRFAGQPFQNLLVWLGKDPGFASKLLRAPGDPVESATPNGVSMTITDKTVG